MYFIQADAYIYGWSLTRIPKPFVGGKNTFSTNVAEIIGCPHTKNKFRSLFHIIYKN